MREKLMQLLRRAGVSFEYRSASEIADDLIEDGVTIPVRCKDCTFCSFNASNESYKCTSMKGLNRAVLADEYCSWGERKEE